MPRLHIVFDAHEEAADGLAALRFAQVEERGGGGLEAPEHDLFGDAPSFLFVSCGERERHSRGALREVLEVGRAVE